MSGRSPSGPPRDDRGDDPGSVSEGVDFVHAPWDLPADDPSGPVDESFSTLTEPESRERDIEGEKRPSAIRNGREMARIKLAASRAGVDLSKLTNEELEEYLEDARTLAESEEGRIKKRVSVRKTLKNNVLKEIKEERKSTRKEGKASRKEMNKAYNAKLSVSLGKLAWHLTGGKIARKVKEVYRELPLAGQAAVSGIGSAAVTLAAVELFNYTTGHLEGVVDQSLPHIGRPAEAIAAISLGLVGAVVGPATTWAKQLTGEDLVEFMYKAGSSLGRVVGKGRRLVSRPERSEEDRLRDMEESARRRREEMADDDEIWTSTE